MGTKAHRRAWGRACLEGAEAVQEVEVQADESRKAPSLAPPLPFDLTGFADFAVAGTDVSGEFRCSDCGYGAVVRRALPPCPMCGGIVWESRPPHLVG